MLGSPKPPIDTLIDQLIVDSLGTTAVPIYSLYSSIAHAEGAGLGSLRVMDDRVDTAEDPHFARGLDTRRWSDQVLQPAERGSALAVGAA